MTFPTIISKSSSEHPMVIPAYFPYNGTLSLYISGKPGGIYVKKDEAGPSRYG
jgi:hypothetical protein